jgi:hypothetical protein
MAHPPCNCLRAFGIRKRMAALRIALRQNADPLKTEEDRA